MSSEVPIEIVHRKKALRGLGLVVQHIKKNQIPPVHAMAIEDIEIAYEFLHEPCTPETYNRVSEVCTDILDTEHTFLSRTMTNAECAEFVRTLTALRAYVSDILTRFE